MRTIHFAAVLIAVLTALPLQGQDQQADELFARALRNPNDDQVVGPFLGIAVRDAKTDPMAIRRLHELYEVTTTKQQRQRLAMILMTLGQRDDVYFDELARHAREAVTSDAPMPFFYDGEGNVIRGPRPVAFSNWCQIHELEADACFMKVMDYAVDVMYLGQVKDRRSISILREGLNSHNEAIVMAAAAGLGWLNDVQAIPLLEKAIDRLLPKHRPGVIQALTEFDDPRVGPLLDRLVPDKQWRRQLDESIRLRQQQRPRNPVQ